VTVSSLIRSRELLRNGRGQTTRRDRVLSPSLPLPAIPQRVGSYDHGQYSAVVQEPACVGSDWWTYSAGEQWQAHEWHAALDTLVSSDGVWRVDRQQIRRMSFNGAKPSLSIGPIHLCFASATVAAASPAGAGQTDIVLQETSHAAREWHPKQTVKVFNHSLIGAAQRLKSIEWKQGGTLYTFRWNFKTETDGGVTAASPTCLNRAGNETQTADRLFDGGSVAQPRKRLKKFSLVTPEGKGSVEVRSAPWGFMPAVSRADVALLVDSVAASESNQLNMTDLSRLLSVGQPYHGLCLRTSITDLAGNPLPKPSPMQVPRYGNTRYFKHPAPPGVPASNLLPPDYASAGYQFLDDVVLASGQDYAPGVQMLPTVTAWLHVDAQGIVRVCDLLLVSDTATTTTWDVIRYHQAPGSQMLTYDVLGRFSIETADPYLRGITPSSVQRRTYTGTTDWQRPVSGGGSAPQDPPTVDGAFNTQLQRYIMTESSPDGRQIVVMRGMYNPLNAMSAASMKDMAIIATVAIVNVSEDGVVGTPAVVWDYVHSYHATDLHTQDLCHGFAFRNDGSLWLWLSSEIRWYGAPPEWQRPIPGLTYNGSAIADADLWFGSSSIYRVTNNVLLQTLYKAGVDQGFGRPPVAVVEFSTPGAAYDYTVIMPGNASNRRYASWNPRTEQIAARSNPLSGAAVGPITWI